MTKNLAKRLGNTVLYWLAAVASLVPLGIQGQEVKIVPPQVLSIGVPYYPAVARSSHVEGVVHIEVATNGQAITETHITDGPKVLAPFAESNVRTWTFVKHEPTKFTVTYTYKLVGHVKRDKGYGEVVLRPPDEVEISAMPVLISDPAPDKR